MIRILKNFVTFMHTGSGLRFHRIAHHTINIVNYNLLGGGGRITLDRSFFTGNPSTSGSSYIGTPPKTIGKNMGLINIKKMIKNASSGVMQNSSPTTKVKRYAIHKD